MKNDYGGEYVKIRQFVEMDLKKPKYLSSG